MDKKKKQSLKKNQNCYARALRGSIQAATGFQQAGHISLCDHALADAEAAFKDWLLVTKLLNDKE